MIAWEWDAAAPRAAGYGVSDNEDAARKAAEAWLRANPGGSARYGRTWLTDPGQMLSPWWMPPVVFLQALVLPDGSVTWEERPADMAAAAALRGMA